MWSLPDITRLNSKAHTTKRRLLAHAQRINTGNAKADELCEHCETRPATSATAWFDIFSNDPKGLLLECEPCRDQHGTPEGYFECEACHRLMPTNYTWEMYSHYIDNFGPVCLPCWAEMELADEDNWIKLTDEDIAAITFDVVRKAKHLIGVKMPIPKGIQFLENVELDGSTGGRLTSSSSCESTPDCGVAEVKEILTRAKEDGHERAILILDGAYQFSVSIGIYVPKPKKVKTKHLHPVEASNQGVHHATSR